MVVVLAIVPDRSVVGCLKFVIKCFITNITCIHLPIDTCYMYAFIDRNKKFWYFIVCDQAKTRENQSVIIHLYNNASTSAHGLEHEKNNSTRKHILYLKICTYSCWVIFSCLVRYFFLLTFTWSGPIFVTYIRRCNSTKEPEGAWVFYYFFTSICSVIKSINKTSDF